MIRGMLLPALALALLAADDPNHVDASEVRTQPEYRAIALAVHYCMARDTEQEFLAAIKEEREDGKIAGVVDLASLKHKQDRVVEAREFMKAYLGELKKLAPATDKKLGAKPPNCGNKNLVAARGCADDDQAPGCSGPDMDAFRSLLAETEIQDWKEWRAANR